MVVVMGAQGIVGFYELTRGTCIQGRVQRVKVKRTGEVLLKLLVN